MQTKITDFIDVKDSSPDCEPNQVSDDIGLSELFDSMGVSKNVRKRRK